MLFFLDGLALILSHSEQITTPGTSVTGQLGTFANVFGGGTYSELIWALVIMGVLQVALSFTRWGIYTVATGGNRLGAAEAGVKTRRIAHAQLHVVRGDGRSGRDSRGGAHLQHHAWILRGPTSFFCTRSRR